MLCNVGGILFPTEVVVGTCLNSFTSLRLLVSFREAWDISMVLLASIRFNGVWVKLQPASFDWNLCRCLVPCT